MTVLFKQPGLPASTIFVPNDDFHLFQMLVDGPIETVSLGNGLIAILNEDGKLREDLRPNVPLYYAGELVDILVGNIIICREDGEDFAEIRQRDIDELKERMPELW